MKDTFKIMEKSNELGELLEYNEYRERIPFFAIPDGYEVSFIPPFLGAMSRFLIRKKGKPYTQISVYLDTHGVLGSSAGPYWEIYPDADDENYRCSMEETELLIKEIMLSADKLEREYNE